MPRKRDPVLAETCRLLDINLPAPLQRTGTEKLLWMDRPTLATTLRVAKMRRDRHADGCELLDPELEKKLRRIYRVMIRNNYIMVGEIPINKMTAIATGVRPKRIR